MVRTQIQLTEDQLRRARAVARRERISLAEVIRRCVEAGLSGPLLDRTALYARASKLVGEFEDKSHARDLSSQHDRYLDEARG